MVLGIRDILAGSLNSKNHAAGENLAGRISRFGILPALWPSGDDVYNY